MRWKHWLTLLSTSLMACGGGTEPSAFSDDPEAGADASADAPAPDSSAVATLGAPCTTPGKLACAGHGQKLQLLCDGTKWVANGTCSGKQICDTRPGPTQGSCQDPDPNCVGKTPLSPFCDDKTKRVCDADLLSSTATVCADADHCKQGAGATCAKCLKGEQVCEGAVLKRCADDLQSYVVKETCATSALCVATAAACYAPVCAIGEYKCEVNTLETCRDARTAFDPVKVCPDGLCDAALKDCRECAVGAKDCVGAAPRSCDATGHWKTLTACSGSTPVCTSGICAAGACSTGDYRCTGDTLELCNATSTGFDPVTVCGAGMCDAAAKSCDECKSGDVGCVGSTPRACNSAHHWASLTPCSGATPVCSAGVCVDTFCHTGDYRCTGDTLETCNGSLTAYTAVKTCGAGLCDAAIKDCDLCKTGDKDCADTTPRTCDSTHHWVNLTPCSGATPYCSTGACITLPKCNAGTFKVLIAGWLGTGEVPYLPVGSVVTNATETMWKSMTSADFASYQLIVLGEGTTPCLGAPVYQTLYDTRATWTPAVTGRVAVTQQDGVYHAAKPGASTFLRATLQWAATGPGTGLYVGPDCAVRSLDFLSGFGSFTSNVANGDPVHIVAPSHPIVLGSTDASLSNWGSSYHGGIPVYPASFVSVAAQAATTTDPVTVARDAACAP